MMMQLFRFAVLGGIILLTIYKTRINPVYSIAIPMILGLRQSVFFNIRSNTQFNLVSIQDFFFLLILFVWLYSKRKRPNATVTISGHKGTQIAILAFLFFSFELLLSWTTAWTETGRLALLSALSTRKYFYFPISYMLLVNTLCRYSSEDAYKLIKYIANISIFLMILYILDSGLGISIYPYSKFQITSFSETTIVRDFLTFPYWAGIAVAYYVSRGKYDYKVILAFLIIIPAFLLTYTRNKIVSLILMVVIVAISNLLSPCQRRRGIKMLMLIGILGIFVVFILPDLAPAQMGFLKYRFEELTKGEGGIGESSLAYRFNLARQMQEDAGRVDSFFGLGFFEQREHSLQSQTTDSDWIYVPHIMGIGGLIVFGLAILFTAIGSVVSTFRHKTAFNHKLSLVLMLYFIYYMIHSFAGNYFFQWYSLSMVVFALITVDYYEMWQKDASS